MSDDLCTHPPDELETVEYAAGGWLGVPAGPRLMCAGCGEDFGPAREIDDEVSISEESARQAERRQMGLD